jgi:hypothetical protein
LLGVAGFWLYPLGGTWVSPVVGLLVLLVALLPDVGGPFASVAANAPTAGAAASAAANRNARGLCNMRLILPCLLRVSPRSHAKPTPQPRSGLAKRYYHAESTEPNERRCALCAAAG